MTIQPSFENNKDLTFKLKDMKRIFKLDYKAPRSEHMMMNITEMLCQSGGAGYPGDEPVNPPDQPFPSGTTSLDDFVF